VLPNTRALLTFAARFLLIFFLIVPVWFLVTPAYNRLLAVGANLLLALIESPRVTTLVGWKRDIVIVRADAPFRGGTKLQGFTGTLTHFNLILMVALVLAPRRVEWRRRCTVLVAALGLLFVTHVVYLLVGVNFFQQPELEAFQDPVGRLYVWGLNFYLSIASQLFPVLLWMALYRTIGGVSKTEDTEPEAAAGRWRI